MEGINDLKLIKKHYNEKMAHLCRELFPTILEKPGVLYELLTRYFEPSKFLYEDITMKGLVDQFKAYIYSKINITQENQKEVTKTPFELLDEAGYTLYECKTEADIQRFRHYYHRLDGTPTPKYKEGTVPESYQPEELCTFGGGRLKRCHVFFAVKKNVDEIKREDFKEPRREDEYGTSVLSIQFAKNSANTVEIISRYNHTVNNPNNTFNNNPDNIIEGLTESFRKTYSFNTRTDKANFEIPGYVQTNDGKYYKYNYEIDGVYYCPNNVVIVYHEAKYYDPARYIVMDYFLLDMKEKTIISKEMDNFRYQIPKIDKVEQKVDKETGTRKVIINDDIVITLDKRNIIVGYSNPKATVIGSNFLKYNRHLASIDLPNVEEIGENFLLMNERLLDLHLPKAKKIGDGFLKINYALGTIDLPKVKKIGDHFLANNSWLEEISFPELEEVGNYFFGDTATIETIELPKLKRIGSFFMRKSAELKIVDLPEVEEVGMDFLAYDNYGVSEVNMPKLRKVGSNFLHNNSKIRKLHLPSLVDINDGFLTHNSILEEISLPNVEFIGDRFLEHDETMTEINLPKVKFIGNNFMFYGRRLRKISLPNVTKICNNFLTCNKMIEEISLPNVISIGYRFLGGNNKISVINLPKLEQLGIDAFSVNCSVTEIYLPKLKELEDGFLGNAVKDLRVVYAPLLDEKTLEKIKKKMKREYKSNIGVIPEEQKTK